MSDAHLIDWLLDSDPALRWQVQRDLLHESDDVWGATKARVATEGFGARLLALQDADGQWAGGAFFPSDVREDEPQPWTATTWSLKALREWGVEASVLGDTAERLARNSTWEYDDLPYWGGEVDVCINSYTLATGTWLGVDMSALAQWFVEHRLEDGGWNCEWVEGSTRSSFHSTINALRGLLCHESATGGTEATRAARKAGEEYLLERALVRRLSTSEQVAPWVDSFTYPTRWKYSVLRAASHFRLVSEWEGTPPDSRLAEAIELIQAARQPDGTWLQTNRQTGREWFEVDVPDGEPSQWITLDALRVLAWWEARA